MRGLMRESFLTGRLSGIVATTVGPPCYAVGELVS